MQGHSARRRSSLAAAGARVDGAAPGVTSRRVTRKGKTALVTGANRGLGLETARQLAAQGLGVIVTARDGNAARSAAAEIGADSHALDVADVERVVGLASELARADRRIDVVINNAGVALDGFDARVALETLEVNYRGVARVTDVLAPLVTDGGCIVNVSSGMGDLSIFPAPLRRRFADPELGREALAGLMDEFVRAVAEGRHVEQGWPSNAYRVSKAALNALTRIFARELAPRGIRVNAVCPGWVRTRMGGASAGRSVADGARGIVWAALLPADGPSGSFFRDGREIPW